MQTDALDSVRHQINCGERQEARIRLVSLLEAEPDNAEAWALLAILVTHPAEQARCYREILRIDPENRQAAFWLEALGAAEPPAQETADGFERGEPVLSDQRQLAPPTAEGEDEMERLLDEVSLPSPYGGQEQPSREPVDPQRREERIGFLDGLLGRRRRGATESEVEDLLTGQGEIPSAAGALSPELILKLAGGPLAPEERRNCPHCDAVVSRRETRCPWCSVPLVDAGDG